MSTIPDHPTSAQTLFTPADPPPVALCNEDGPGQGVIVCDHASNAVPERLNGLGLPPQALRRHIAYDIGARGIAEIVSDRLAMPAVIGGFSRLVIDLNRPEDDFTCIREIYDGAVIPGNRRLSPDAMAARIEGILHPYHNAVERLLAEKEKTVRHPAVISIHSCTDEYQGLHRPWHIGVLSNRDRRMADRVLERLAAHRPDLVIGDNLPYSGMAPYGHTIERHALPQGRPNVLFEVRQDLIGHAEGQREFGDLLATVLEEVLGDPSIFTRFTG
ncbi:hypothetical protein HH303_15700 [Rhodospirillaceae bacterium KN72]|uniref:N-formylglutamate amidohydrolase n=1 Tax=Pacificispira spongiicola TaxID=2729598 RepID=A0A7Y0E2B0_9PROT|nr:N-formylglutamate amidohydrolase [Pacificispira spongiicola]NMM45942.1 hypothetical protein [Pacificispira spongiicola]